MIPPALLVLLSVMVAVFAIDRCARFIEIPEAIAAVQLYDAASLRRIEGTCGDRLTDWPATNWQPPYFARSDIGDVSVLTTYKTPTPAPAFDASDLIADGAINAGVMPANLTWRTEQTVGGRVNVTVTATDPSALDSLITVSSRRVGTFTSANTFVYVLQKRPRADIPPGGYTASTAFYSHCA